MWHLAAVVDYFAAGAQSVDMVGAEGEYRHASNCIGFFDSMEHAHRVVHHTEGIDHGTEAVFEEATADVLGKTRPYEQHTLAGLYFETGLGNVDDGSELHIAKVSIFLQNGDRVVINLTCTIGWSHPCQSMVHALSDISIFCTGIRYHLDAAIP